MQPFSTGVDANSMSDEPADRLRAVCGPDKYEWLLPLQAKSINESRGEPFVSLVDRFCCFPADV